MKPKSASILSVPVRDLSAYGLTDPADSRQDFVSAEDPLQIRVGDKDVAVTMRTPGHDRELAAGFLFTEAILRDPAQIQSISTDQRGAVTVTLASTEDFEIGVRNFYVTSSCGVCGKASIDALSEAGVTRLNTGTPKISPSILFGLPDKLRAAQTIFEHTGGLHGAGLFTASGRLLAVREDVGRHNAVDKLIGAAFLENRLPLGECILMLSGRVSFELVQKAVMAGIPIIAAVGAPSSLAVETSLRFGVTLIGFLRGQRGNVYADCGRILPIAS